MSPSCCEPFHRVTPSGRIQAFHDRGCPRYPGVLIGTERPLRERRPPPLPPIRVRASHDWRTCSLPGCLECAYVEAHLDDADDARARR